MTRVRPRGQLPVKAKVEYGVVRLLPGDGVSVVVYGRPAPQGSKTPLLEESNPRTKPWRAAIKKVCDDYKPADFVPLDGALEVDVWFYFDPPASATKGDLPTTKHTYDGDKLTRALFDGLVEGGVIVDDARVVDGHFHKRYVWDGGQARAVAVVTRHSP